MTTSIDQTLDRQAILPPADRRDGAALLGEGKALARDWRLGPSVFLDSVDEDSEAAYKRRQSAQGEIMLHAQVGYRDLAKSRQAYREIYETCATAGVRVDRYGLCLDWSMGYPRQLRSQGLRGTGLILESPEQFAALTAEAPVAPHFGDFVLGFPGALEATQGALAAGSTAIGNLGQYFTFRLPGWDDEVASTEATLRALGLIAGQDREILIHSNLDDGFAAHFSDLACSLGAALIERTIIEELIGLPLAHCFGHHFTDPLTRLAFQLALTCCSQTPGSMIYGATVSYKGQGAANYASLGHYFLADVLGQRWQPSGHALNPVPVTENQRIPEIDEIIEAQLFAQRLIEQAPGYAPLIDRPAVKAMVEMLVAGAEHFHDQVMAGLAEAGFDRQNPFEMLLSLKRIGGRRLERLYGPGRVDPQAPHGRKALVPATTYGELERLAEDRLAGVAASDRQAIAAAKLQVLTATTDVHEHGKVLVELLFSKLAVEVADGGVSVDADRLAQQAEESGADLIAISTYNGVALTFIEALQAELSSRGLVLPVLIGGRLNQIPDNSNTSLPVEVGAELRAAGAIVCPEIEDALPALLAAAAGKTEDPAA